MKRRNRREKPYFLKKRRQQKTETIQKQMFCSLVARKCKKERIKKGSSQIKENLLKRDTFKKDN